MVCRIAIIATMTCDWRRSTPPIDCSDRNWRPCGSVNMACRKPVIASRTRTRFCVVKMDVWFASLSPLDVTAKDRCRVSMTTVKQMNFPMNCGDVMCAKKTKITAGRDDDQDAIEAILSHIARYRVSTFAVLSRLPHFADESPRHLRRLLRDCREAGLVTSAALHSGSRYWFLTPAGATRCGLDESRSGPMSETAKLRAYALLLFCCTSDKPRHRLTASELSQQFSCAASARNARHVLLRPDRQGIDRSGTYRCRTSWTLGSCRAIRAGRHLAAQKIARLSATHQGSSF
jgi:hypothetical protein